MAYSVRQRLCRAWNTWLKPPLATGRQVPSKLSRVKTGRPPSRCSTPAAMGVVTARALQAPRAPGRPGCTLRFLRGRFQEGGVASGEELVQPREGGESQREP